LAKNDTKKLRLFNVWATWCAPCVAEFPELVALARRMDMRDFELVTISLDEPKLEPRVREFLERNHAAPADRLKRELKKEGRHTLNFLFTETGTDGLVAALDPKWEGPLPHTVLIAPGGDIVYRHTGAIDPSELRAKVIEVMSPYYRPGVDK
jgi:thiol-disulfide isomerase/thioredoxin